MSKPESVSELKSAKVAVSVAYSEDGTTKVLASAVGDKAEAMIALTPWINAQQVEGYTEFVAGQPALAAVESNFFIGVSFPSVTGSSETRDAIGEMITVIGGGADAAEALAACVETCNNALQGK